MSVNSPSPTAPPHHYGHPSAFRNLPSGKGLRPGRRGAPLAPPPPTEVAVRIGCLGGKGLLGLLVPSGGQAPRAGVQAPGNAPIGRSISNFCLQGSGNARWFRFPLGACVLYGPARTGLPSKPLGPGPSPHAAGAPCVDTGRAVCGDAGGPARSPVTVVLLPPPCFPRGPLRFPGQTWWGRGNRGRALRAPPTHGGPSPPETPHLGGRPAPGHSDTEATRTRAGRPPRLIGGHGLGAAVTHARAQPVPGTLRRDPAQRAVWAKCLQTGCHVSPVLVTRDAPGWRPNPAECSGGGGDTGRRWRPSESEAPASRPAARWGHGRARVPGGDASDGRKILSGRPSPQTRCSSPSPRAPPRDIPAPEDAEMPTRRDRARRPPGRDRGRTGSGLGTRLASRGCRGCGSRRGPGRAGSWRAL